MGGFLVPVIEVIIYLLHIYWWIIIISAVMSWLIAFNVINTHSRPVAMIGDFLYRATEPALRPIRHFLPNLGGLDISPIILLLILWFIERELIQLAARRLAILRRWRRPCPSPPRPTGCGFPCGSRPRRPLSASSASPRKRMAVSRSRWR